MFLSAFLVETIAAVRIRLSFIMRRRFCGCDFICSVIESKLMFSAPKTIREQVTNQLRDDLVSGRYEPGTRLRETEVSKQFGVSRGPVRDAFIQLSQEGFLAYNANRGVVVCHPPKPEDREFIASLRFQIEKRVVEKGLSQLTDVGITEIEFRIERLRTACEFGEATRVALCDVEFHEAIMIACGGSDLVGAWRQLCSRMLLTYTRLRNYEEAYQEHVTIFEALKKRKVKQSVNALKANIR